RKNQWRLLQRNGLAHWRCFKLASNRFPIVIKLSPMLVQNIKVAVDAMVFAGSGDALQLLLIKRKYNPYEGMWAIPGGFVEDDEELEAAAIRELEEEPGLKVPAMQQLYTFGRVGRDARGRTITVTYYAFIDDAE